MNEWHEDDYHIPIVVYFDEYHVETPAEVCSGCSDIIKGIWVPVSFCEIAKEKLGPLPWGDHDA